MSYQHVNAPDRVLENHLRQGHKKSTSWIEDHADDLRSAHASEHHSGHADHGINEDLHH